MSSGRLRHLAVVALAGAALGAATALALLPLAHIGVFGRAGLIDRAQHISGTARVGGPFNLIDQTGARVTDKDLRGRFMLVLFGYTRSREVTPASLQVVTDALNRLGKNASKFQPVFISLDPEHDTPRRLAAMITRSHPRFMALTGERPEIDKLARAYFVHPSREPRNDRAGKGRITYAAYIFVMDRTGAYVTHFSFATPVAEIVERLRKLVH
jgi:protein SCO1/2